MTGHVHAGSAPSGAPYGPCGRRSSSLATGAAALAAGVMAALATGCGGQPAHLRTENGQLRDELAALRDDARRNRHKARDLENQLHLLQDRLETARVERDRAPGVEVVLPVEIRAPDGDAGDVAGAAYADDGGIDGATADEPVVLAGEAADGTEIVYAGEARRDRSVAPRYRPSPRASPRASPPGADGGPGDVSGVRTPHVPSEHARLPVTRSVGPTVEQQIRRAERAQARRRAPAAGDAGSATPAAESSPPPGARGSERARDEAAPPASPARAARRAGDTPQAEYRRLYAALREGDHAAAIAGFREFVRRHPRHDYADNAQYWLGEAYYDQRDYAAALTEFRRVVTDHPRGNKVPDALLKIGYCYAALGEPAKARQVLIQVVEIYPKSDPAGLARERLATLSQDGAP